MTWRMESSQVCGPETRIEFGKPVTYKDVCVHEFTIGDVEDPMLYAGEPIYKWSVSEQGQWVIANAVETPYWIQDADILSWGYRYRIMARLSEQNQIFWQLKWGNK